MTVVPSFLQALPTFLPHDQLLVFFFATTCALLWCLWLFSKSRVRNCRILPGPLGLPLLGNLPFLQPELHRYFARLTQTFGPVFALRLGSRTAVVVSSPTVVSEVLKDHDVAFSNHDVPAVAMVGTYGGVDIPWSPYGPHWRMLRKIAVTKMLGNTALDSLYELRRREIRAAAAYFYKCAGSTVNLGEQIFLTDFKVVTSMLWGSTVGKDEQSKFGLEFRGLVSKFVDLLGAPNVSDFFPALAGLDLQGLERRMEKLVGKLDDIFDDMISRQMGKDGTEERSDKPMDFLQKILKSIKEDAGDTSNMSMIHVKALLVDMIVAGTDTTSNATEFAMAELLKNPEILKRAQEEVDVVVGSEGIVEESHIPKLSYLQAVMKETLRLHPVVPLLIPRRPSQTCTVGGYTIPKDSKVFFNVWSIQNDPSIWKNPHEFNPERFLGDEHWDFTGKDCRYLPFGFGRRICPGIALGERVVLHTLATILHSFDWGVPEGSELSCEEKFGMVLTPKSPVMVIPIPRLSDPKLYE